MHSTPQMHKSFWEYHQAFEHRTSAWKDEVLFTWEWWLGICLTITPWVIWLIFRKKNSTDRLLYSGLLVALVTVTLDNIGIQLGLWNYLKPVTPAIPSYIPFDFALMPVVIMLLIQFCHHKNSWLIGVLFAIVTAFIGEPIFAWLGIYVGVHWHHVFSIPIYTVIYVLAFKLSKRNRFKELN